ncbi:MAG: amino acid ABC transporter permease [Anaerolineales bacterium]
MKAQTGEADRQGAFPLGRRLDPLTGKLSGFPWWLIAILLIALGTAYFIFTRQNFRDAFDFIVIGISITISTTLYAFSIAIVIGLIAGLGRVSRNPLLRNVSRLYVELVRGIPILVLIFYVALVAAPDAARFLGVENDLPLNFRAIIALSITYGAFLAEIFRAGIQSIGRGQMEAARSLGMSYAQAMRYVILPQAIRNVLPALGNDFLALV